MIYAYIFVMAGVTYPYSYAAADFDSEKISNSYIRSFLYYIPYACLTAMTFPAILYATQSPVSALAGFAVAGVAGAEETKSGDCGFVFLRGCICGRADNGDRVRRWLWLISEGK